MDGGRGKNAGSNFTQYTKNRRTNLKQITVGSGFTIS